MQVAAMVASKVNENTANEEAKPLLGRAKALFQFHHRRPVEVEEAMVVSNKQTDSWNSSRPR
jgi:hypothetical protein